MFIIFIPITKLLFILQKQEVKERTRELPLIIRIECAKAKVEKIKLYIPYILYIHLYIYIILLIVNHNCIQNKERT